MSLTRRAAVFARPVSVATMAALLALSLCAWQLTIPRVLSGVTEIDDGVYLGAALRLVSGAAPYRDFLFVQPPGILVLMSPIALVGKAIGARGALVAARIVTAVVTGGNAGFVAWLVRARGRTAMAVAGGAQAAFPLAVAADHTLLLEPYLVLFLLLGSIVAFSGAEPSNRRLVIAGILFGVAAAVKLWAFFPFLALLVCFMPEVRRALCVLVGGAAGFLVVCLPFALTAPRAFLREVLLDQVSRPHSAVLSVPLNVRITEIAGVALHAKHPSSPLLAYGLLGGLGLLAAIVLGSKLKVVPRLEVFVFLAALAAVGILMGAPVFSAHYVYFSAPFLAALLGLVVSGTARIIRERRGGSALGRRGRLGASMAGLALLGMLVAEATSYSSWFLLTDFAHDEHSIVEPGSAIDRVIPQGACAVSDLGILLIEADRYLSTRPGCPPIVDPYGMWLPYGLSPPGLHSSARAHYPAPLVTAWRSYLGAAEYVVLSNPHANYIPWSPTLTSWFRRHYVLRLSVPGIYVYAREGSPSVARGAAEPGRSEPSLRRVAKAGHLLFAAPGRH